MQRHFWTRPGGLLGVALVLASAAVARADGPPKADFPSLPTWRMFADEFPGDPTLLPGVPELVKPSPYWLGLGCRPVPPVLRAHLKLPENEGLVVEQVMPDSPAAKAGIEPYDVIVRADEKPVGKLQELIDAVDAAKDKEMTLKVIHGGKSTEIKVTPAKRPEPAEQIFPSPPEARGDDQTGRWFEWFEPKGEGKPPWRLRFWGPGWIVPPDAQPHPPLPGNLAVTITRSGDEPAKIVVKRGDEKWEVTEDQLDKLPEDIRPHVERMLGKVTERRGGKWSYDFDFVPDWRPPHWEGMPQGQLDKRMEEMSRRIEELRKSLEELRQGRPRLKAAPKLKEAPPREESAPEPAEEAPQKKADRV